MKPCKSLGSSLTLDQVDSGLRSYIETSVFPEYSKNDWGHQLGHINYVIRRSFEFAKTVAQPLNPNIIYTIAAYHDIGHHIDAIHHEKVSAKMLREDRQLRQFFSAEEIEIIARAIEDHRSCYEQPPRSIYGQIVASADCNINIDVMMRSTYAYRLRNFRNMSLDEIICGARQHLISKYGRQGYALKKMFFDDPEFEAALYELQDLTNDEELFRRRFLAANQLG